MPDNFINQIDISLRFFKSGFCQYCLKTYLQRSSPLFYTIMILQYLLDVLFFQYCFQKKKISILQRDNTESNRFVGILRSFYRK